jgi:hypothetical protein
MLAEKACQGEEEGCLAHEEEHRRIGPHWVNLDDDHIEDVLSDT